MDEGLNFLKCDGAFDGFVYSGIHMSERVGLGGQTLFESTIVNCAKDAHVKRTAVFRYPTLSQIAFIMQHGGIVDI